MRPDARTRVSTWEKHLNAMAELNRLLHEAAARSTHTPPPRTVSFGGRTKNMNHRDLLYELAEKACLDGAETDAERLICEQAYALALIGQGAVGAKEVVRQILERSRSRGATLDEGEQALASRAHTHRPQEGR